MSSDDHKGDGTDTIQHPSKKLKQVRVYVDGCFDILHYGHANALRQAKKLGDVLVVGVHSDAEIKKNKGPPVMKEEERYKLIRSMKWVDEVVEGAPYSCTLEVLDKHNCDFCAHGDDISSTIGGEDAYLPVKKTGRYREYKRTEGVSTTDLVGRMLLMTKSHFGVKASESKPVIGMDTKQLARLNQSATTPRSPYTNSGGFLATTKKIMQFQEGTDNEPGPGDTVVYVPGAFDLFHVGHVELLEKCKKIGNFIVVGIHDDWEVNRYKGQNYPIKNMQERVLSVLACKHVSEVIIGAPFSVTPELLDQFKINYVVHGSTNIHPAEDGSDPYQVARDRGIFRNVDSGSEITTDTIVGRVISNRETYMRRNAAKENREVTSELKRRQSQNQEEASS